ncbi:AAA family ATPase [Gracilimonas mengyeensis]|uniref:ORC1/DEAH AAA+ ATPase domain-containing protein n=1 Tax=Gracilimonas mengyeensis TaxID=1302730 RepID=A0A521BCU8_9BACT|nr:AAA family ATPase [Gracilimonas mengyeensis]SMO44898.1 hypothetical protein SAMN06265219_102194 [Gracilimonas mengyeensis]
MQSDISREDIKARLKDQWLPDLQRDLKELLLKDIGADKDKIERVAAELRSGDTLRAFRLLAEGWQKSGNQKEDGSNEKPKLLPWQAEIYKIAADIPEEAELVQEEARFKASGDDSMYIQLAKGTKRLWRVVSNGSQWRQHIPLRNLVLSHMSMYGSWVTEYRHELLKIRGELLLQIDAWCIAYGSSWNQEESSKAVASGADTPKGPEAGVPKDELQHIFDEILKRLDVLEATYAGKLQEKKIRVEEEIDRGLDVTGTVERSSRKYEKVKVEDNLRSLASQHQKQEEHWQQLMAKLADKLLLSVNFINLHLQASERIEGFSSSIAEFFEINLQQPLEEIKEGLAATMVTFESSDKQTMDEIKQLSSRYRKSLSEQTEKHLLKPLRELTTEAVMSTRFDRFTSAMPDWVNQQPEKAILVDHINLDMKPPHYEVQQVNWQALVRRVVNNQLVTNLAPGKVRFEQFLEELSSGLREFLQIINTNLELINEVKESDEEEPFEVALEGLQRGAQQLDELIKKVEARKSALLGLIKEKEEETFAKLGRLLEEQDANDMRMAGAEFKARETAVDWNTKVKAIWARWLEKGELMVRFIWKKLKDFYTRAEELLGFSSEKNLDSSSTDLATFLAETDEKIESLPFIYRRLFDFQKKVDDRFYIRQTEQLERLKKGYELWQNNFPSVFAVVGEKGSGKSLFLHMLEEEVLKREEVVEINFEATLFEAEEVMEKVAKDLGLAEIDSTEGLIEAINERESRSVVMLENIQNCFIRNLAGYEAIEQLLYLISETNKQVLWIASSTRYGWSFLDKVTSIADYFTHAVESDKLGPEQIQELILRRHRATGYQLVFLPEEATKKSRTYRKLLDDEEKKQEYLQQQFFEKLSKLAEGNSSIAMIYWIRSIKEYDDSYFYINPFQFSNVNRISDLDNEELFVLASFVLHDTLTPEELHNVMHHSLRHSRLMVSRLTSRSILLKTDHGYTLNHLIYRQVIRVLKEANILH